MIQHKLKKSDLIHENIHFQFIDGNRVIIFGRDAFFIHDLNQSEDVITVKCSIPVKYVKLGNRAFIYKYAHKVLLCYDPDSFKKLESIKGLKSHITDIAKYDNQTLAIASGKDVYFLNINTDELTKIYSNPYYENSYEIQNICFSDDRKFMIVYRTDVGTEYDTVVWNFEDNEEFLKTNWRPFDYSGDIVFIKDNGLVKNTFATASIQPEMKNCFDTLSLENGEELRWTPSGYLIQGLSDKGNYAISKKENEVELRDPKNDQILFNSGSIAEKVHSVRLSENEQLVGAVTDKHFLYWNLEK